jgi:hypothetical protein
MAKRVPPVNPSCPRAGRTTSWGRMNAKDKERLAAALRENLRRRKAQARDAAGQPKKDPAQPAKE